jgi:hypothetical protein
VSANPEQDLAQLGDLLRHPGFALLCERFNRRMEDERDGCMNQENDVEAAKLRRAYQIVKTLHPAEEVERLISHAKRAIARDNTSTDGA